MLCTWTPGLALAPLLHPQWKYYLIIKRSEVMIHAATWMNLENMLSERSQSLGIMQTVYDSVYVKCPNRKICRDGRWIAGCLGMGELEGVGGVVVVIMNGYGALGGVMRKMF